MCEKTLATQRSTAAPKKEGSPASEEGAARPAAAAAAAARAEARRPRRPRRWFATGAPRRKERVRETGKTGSGNGSGGNGSGGGSGGGSDGDVPVDAANRGNASGDGDGGSDPASGNAAAAAAAAAVAAARRPKFHVLVASLDAAAQDVLLLRQVAWETLILSEEESSQRSVTMSMLPRINTVQSANRVLMLDGKLPTTIGELLSITDFIKQSPEGMLALERHLLGLEDHDAFAEATGILEQVTLDLSILRPPKNDAGPANAAAGADATLGRVAPAGHRRARRRRAPPPPGRDGGGGGAAAAAPPAAPGRGGVPGEPFPRGDDVLGERAGRRRVRGGTGRRRRRVRRRRFEARSVRGG